MAKTYSSGYYLNEIRSGNRTILSRAITFAESNKLEHKKQSQEIIEKCYPYSGKSLRIGITGAPGVGKSTFIESLGNYLLNEGKKIAVLAIDPSSRKSSGSILGDKTRMEKLSSHENVFIRPSPSAGELGGTGVATREAIILCEAAGYEIIFVETVGVGQSETEVHSIVDFFLLLTIAGAGDELQGIKRGIMEMADLIVINKTDNANLSAQSDGVRHPITIGSADKSQISNLKSQISNALHLFPPTESGWIPKVLTCSSLTGEGIEDIWKTISAYIELIKGNSFFEHNRTEQIKFWFRESLEREIKNNFYNNKKIKQLLNKTEKEVLKGKLNPAAAAKKLVVWTR